jgi:CPA1 family monovalent cation:H+ antiporter
MTASGFQLAAGFFVIVAIAGWLNVRLGRLPTAVAMVLAGSACAGLLLTLDRLGIASREVAPLLAAVRAVDFQLAVLGYLLAFLLFAGAMQVDLPELLHRLAPIASLASLGVVVSALLAGGGVWCASRLLGLDLPLAWAVAFGALIAPTDPIAVLAAVHGGRFSEDLKSVLLGEALFNDGVGIVLFGAAVSVATAQTSPDFPALVGRVALEALGAVVLGVLAGAVAVRAMRAIDDYAVEVSVTIALAMGVYAVAHIIGVSGPIAVAAAGLLVGERGFATAMSETTRRYVRGFWTLVDDILNAGLFLLLGLELAAAPPNLAYAGLALAAIVLVTVARWITVLPWGLYFRLRHGERRATTVLAWGGVHGAISLALAFSLPAGPARPVVLTITFAVVIASVLIQGLTFPRLARALAPAAGPQKAAD